MAIVEGKYRCDWPECGREITVEDGGTLSDQRWEFRSGDRVVCDRHRWHSSVDLDGAIRAADRKAAGQPLYTPEEFAAKMREIAKQKPDAAHGDADELMEKLLVSLGYEEGIRVMQGMTRWYA